MTRRHPTALLVIDMQNAYFNNGALAKESRRLISACNALIDAALGQDVPVILVRTEHIRDRSTWTLNMLDDGKGYLYEGADDSKFVSGLHTERTSELIKTRDSAFYGTDLNGRLHTLGIQNLIIAGVSTHSCILFTAADAYAANFRVTLAIDAIASHDPDYHDAVLAMLKQEYRQKLLSNDQILTQL